MKNFREIYMNTENFDNKNFEYTGISQRVFQDIQTIAEKYNTAKILLFGSRARGTHQDKSDIDLAVYGCRNFNAFSYAMEENVWTLLKMDLINMDETISIELKSEIEKDGVEGFERIAAI